MSSIRGTTSQLAENTLNVRHGFSRAVQATAMRALAPEVRLLGMPEPAGP
jgi:hypothetical protein